jgi:two-component system heavy metal sensor histidine kinase CusS
MTTREVSKPGMTRLGVKRLGSMRLSVRGRLTAWYGLVLGVILVLFSAVVYLLMQQSLYARIEFELDEELVELRKEVILAIDKPDLLRQLELRFGQHFSYEYEVSDAAGTRLFISDRIRNSDGLGTSRFHHQLSNGINGGAQTMIETQSLTEMGEYRVAGQIVESKHGPLIMQVATPLATCNVDLRGLLTVLLTAGPLALIVALGFGYGLARTALLPVAQMTAAAKQMTVQHLARRLDVSPVDDELSQLATTLNLMMDRLQRSFEEIRRFTADAAHEIRTPLTVIRNEAEVILRLPRSPEQYQRTLHSIIDETLHMAHFADQLLMLCRADVDMNRKQSVVPLDLDLADAVESLGPLARQKQIQIDLSLDESLYVIAASFQLQQLWRNLIENAVKYTPERGQVRIASKSDSDSVIVTVADTGIGIPPEHLLHVFERFYRVDPSRQRNSGGVGLGLAICQSIAEGLSGEIHIDSTVGQGTCVTVKLPRVLDSDDSSS